jgi:PAS domain S-box-containing protein
MTNKRIKKLEPFHIFGFAVSLTLTIFTLVVVTINLNLRNEIRNQIINRDAETINLFTLMDRSAENIEKLPEVVAPWIQKNNSLTPSLWSSDLKGIIALQVFDADGNLKLTIPDNLIPASLKKEDFLKLQQLTLVSKFHEEIWLYSLFDDPRFILMDSPVPLLEVIIPVHAEKSNKLEVIFQYWVEGNSMSAELSQLDRQILVQTLIALGIGYLLILTLLIFAFKQLKAANKSLVDEIEQRKAVEKELERFRLVLDEAGEMIFITDIQTGQFIDVNEAACKQLGYSREELLNLSISDINLRYQSIQELLSQHENAIAEIGFVDEELYRRKDGSMFPAEVSISSKLIENQSFLLAVARNITKRKIAEEALQKVHSELETRVIERTTELKKTTDELKKEVQEGKRKEEERRQLEIQLYQTQKMEALGTLAGGIAHDFNTLLGTIIGYSDMILDDVSEDSKIRNYVKPILKVANRAKTLVLQIGDFSRPKGTDKKLIDATSSIRNSVDFLKTIFPVTIQIQEDYQNDDFIIKANINEINQLIVNLCSNARDFMNENRGSLRISTEKVKNNMLKEYPALDRCDYLKLSISDNGSGVEPGVINKIFDPFFTTKEIGKGSGMGLSIVHSIIKNHDGHIFVDSTPGKGTTFQMLFPLVDAVPEQNT